MQLFSVGYSLVGLEGKLMDLLPECLHQHRFLLRKNHLLLQFFQVSFPELQLHDLQQSEELAL
ncbi:MAG: hypothetical protein FJ390_00770 [Verrucomicrobia bacterium]|nr:hypothetical protein [Verrucomicrobiota bacterium]